MPIEKKTIRVLGLSVEHVDQSAIGDLDYALAEDHIKLFS
jgi:hypothetical protein